MTSTPTPSASTTTRRSPARPSSSAAAAGPTPPSSVTGAKPSARHGAVHVHEQACADELGGAHFRFDTTQPFAEPNEIWPLFTSDAAGASGLVEVTKAVRAGPQAVSVVVHDPDNAARRIGCADLAPGTADLTYAGAFGDGTTGTGADPDHTYAAPGTYTATVTVAHASGEHAGHLSVSDSVQVVVGLGGPPTARRPTRPRPRSPVPVVDSTPPRISRVGPVRTVRTARPIVTRARARPRLGRDEEGDRAPRRRPPRHAVCVRPAARDRALAAREGAGARAPRRTPRGHRRGRQPRVAEVALHRPVKRAAVRPRSRPSRPRSRRSARGWPGC